MAKSQIAIIGTGLIGTSIGLNLAAKPDRAYTIVGADRDRNAARTAKRMGAIDRDVGSLEDALDGSGLVILAIPVLAARQLLQDAAAYLQPGAVVTDTCSTKVDVMLWAGEYLPEGIHFVGGHPMAGKEQSGPAAASVDLFREATWAVTPSPSADESAVHIILGLIESMGATPLYIDPAEHDQYTAAVSHMPILLSVALFRMARDSQGWEDIALLSGPAFKDLTRLASGDPTMAADIIETNRDAILHWLGRYREELDTIAKAIQLGAGPVTDLLESTQLDRDTFLMNPQLRRRPEGVPLPSAQDAMGRLFVGGMYDKLKQATAYYSATERERRQIEARDGDGARRLPGGGGRP